MNTDFYLPRKLSANGRIYDERSLLETSNHVVVLSEPGGGKTALLRSLSEQLGVSSVSANVFTHIGSDTTNQALVVDAFDELAKIDHTGIHKLLANARKMNPTHFIISSRSSEWNNAASHYFEEFIGHAPLVVRLLEFDKDEQCAIFNNHVTGEDFSEFCAEITRFDLDVLLPNPQFLKLFADAYLESDKHFISKKSIFSLAVERLAREANPKISDKHNSLSIADKVFLGSEIFTKLLLSGAEGVTTNEASENRVYPLISSLSNSAFNSFNILATRLFKPGDFQDQHLPIHKVVAEYCAADYLTKRISDPNDSLTLSRCLPIIAPNSTVRDELRGLVGWMASLGSQEIEQTTIMLDPYAILANGDPSQLNLSSKRLLIRRLKEIESTDPYFRRGDLWRRFSVAGFFTSDVMEDVRPLLEFGNDGHLRDLILELLVGSKAAEHLRFELQQISLSPSEHGNTRILATRILLNLKSHEHISNLKHLTTEGSLGSLRIAAEIIEFLYSNTFDNSLLLSFFKSCSHLYLQDEDFYNRTIGDRHFIKRLIGKLNLETIELLLDPISSELACKCNKSQYECECRTGTSKIVGAMLDRFFELKHSDYSPERIWNWIENLSFQYPQSVDQSKAVKVLRENIELRQKIFSHAFRRLTDRDSIFETKIHKFDLHSHSGLGIYSNDQKFLVDLAFTEDNSALWASFIPPHRKHNNRDERGPDNFRAHLRSQALAKPKFMREWSRVNRSYAESEALHGMPNLNRRRNRHNKKQQNIREKRFKYIFANRALIESGRHWGFLHFFTELVLMRPEKIEKEVGEESIARNALKNCLEFIAPSIPDLSELAKLRGLGKNSVAVQVLLASCLEIMHSKGNVEEVELHLLRTLRACINVSYNTKTNDNVLKLKNEIDRLIFAENGSTEAFIRSYVGAQLSTPGCTHPDIWLLHGDEAFTCLRAKLSLEWLNTFPKAPIETLNNLFEIAAQFSIRDKLKNTVTTRFNELNTPTLSTLDNEQTKQMRDFWFIRAFYYMDSTPEAIQKWIQADPEIIHALHERSGRFNHQDSSWPSLSLIKVELILKTFVSQWPKVKLPTHWGTESPKGENAYRFLRDLVWNLNSFDPDDALPVINSLLADIRFSEMHKDLTSIHSDQLRKQALMNFEAPVPSDIVRLLDNQAIITVECLRQVIIEELQIFQSAINGGEFNPVNRFYEKEQRLGEVRSTEIIAERLSLRLQPKEITITLEHQLKNLNRCDFTATKNIRGNSRLLVTEVKGQWHSELYTAASTQLHDRYSIHPNAEHQGIYLILWFGQNEKVAGRKTHDIRTPLELKNSVESTLPQQLNGLIDIFVLDLSRFGK